MLTWEEIQTNGIGAGKPGRTFRAAVRGGWLVAVAGSGVTFYPDPGHRWKPGEDDFPLGQR